MNYTISFKTSSGGNGEIQVPFQHLKTILQNFDNDESYTAYCVEDRNTGTDFKRDVVGLGDYKKLKRKDEL